jgi:hypothetical protein
MDGGPCSESGDITKHDGDLWEEVGDWLSGSER